MNEVINRGCCPPAPAGLPRGWCPHCGGHVPVGRNGAVREHRQGETVCEGSGYPAMPFAPGQAAAGDARCAHCLIIYPPVTGGSDVCGCPCHKSSYYRAAIGWRPPT